MSLLVKVSKMAKENNILVIMDAKRGDIGSTSVAYANAWLGKNSSFGANALTVNPWMGLETLFPFIEVAKKNKNGVFILLKTSCIGFVVTDRVLLMYLFPGLMFNLIFAIPAPS